MNEIYTDLEKSIWIDTKDQLPEKDLYVLTWCNWFDEKWFEIQCYCDGVWWNQDGFLGTSPTHWTNLPKKP